MSKHTQGPWTTVARTNSYIDIEAQNQQGYAAKKIASVSINNHEANARLIAAAPELLEALQLVTMTAGWQYMLAETRDLINAAIAKATGEST